ncbi:hypothetical protein PENCOP_c011G07652 [Penicillium coprophilum]|uniref:C2H2-type domain-containing protein n=1 Tax=Penicillium coprophilum TaxID=36646 RepID=A0A1V6UF75_9EURO|nr:hypothetical protein PENCOP_c011G07652 [Penicillium coprophilum]
MTATIATVLSQCLEEFAELISSGALARYENDVSQPRWSDELGRLRIWAGNIGAHQTGQSSLDYRLRDASHLKNETVKILQRMLRVLRDLSDVVNEEEEDLMGIDDAWFSGTSDTEMDDQHNEMTDIQVLYQSLRNIVNLLFRISMAIRRPADHDRLMEIKIKNASFFEPWAKQHVSHKFPNAEADTASRLSAAMARQKAVLKYFERHKAKLSKGLVATGETESNYLSETVATEMAVSDEVGQLQFLETNSMSGVSQTSYAPSMFTANESLSIPNPPRESADKNPFECPYCCLVITIRNAKDWAHHIFRDLMPYVCLSPECSTPSKLYGSRRQWYQHICEDHPAPENLQNGLNCPLCQVSIQPPLAFERHVGHHMEQLALFVLPRLDPGELGQSEASSEPGSLAVAGNMSNPSSDSGRMRFQNEYQDPSTRPLVEGFGADETHAEKRTVNSDTPYADLFPPYTERGGIESMTVPFYDRITRSREENPERRVLRESQLLTIDTLLSDDEPPEFPDHPKVPGWVSGWVSGFSEPSRVPEPLMVPEPPKFPEPPKVPDWVSEFSEPLKVPDWLSEFSEPPTAPDRLLGLSDKIPNNAEKETMEAYASTRPQERFDRDELASQNSGNVPGTERGMIHASKRRWDRQHGRSSNLDADMSGSDLQSYRTDRLGNRVTWIRKEEGSDIVSLDNNEQNLHSLQLSPSSKDSTRQKMNESHKQVGDIAPGSSSAIKPGVLPEGTMDPQYNYISGDPNHIQEDAVYHKEEKTAGIPPGARWTKIHRRIINPAALEAENERFEERSDFVIVMRVLSREEIEAYAVKTQEIRVAETALKSTVWNRVA